MTTAKSRGSTIHVGDRGPIRTAGLQIYIKPSETVTPPIYLAIKTGHASVWEFLTSRQARELAAELAAVADVVDAGGPEYGSPSFDEVVDAKMKDLKFIEVAAPEAVTG